MRLSFTRNSALVLGATVALVFLWLQPAQAQVGPCPYGGPSPGYRVVGQTPAGNGVASVLLCEPTNDEQPQQQQEQQQQQQQPQKIWIDSYASVVGHPDANDIWAAWNVRPEQGGFEGADSFAMNACKAAMGDGCQVMDNVRNGSVVAMRTHAGYLSASYGETETQAEVNAYRWCRTNYYSCTSLRTVTAAPWKEYGGAVQGSNNAQLYDPSQKAGGVPRNLHGAVAWAVNAGSMAVAKVWVSGGNKTQAEAKAAVLKNCDAYLAKAGLAGKCEVPLIAANQIIVVATDEKKTTRVSSGDDLEAAEWSLHVWQCRDNNLTCTTVASFDAGKEGNASFDIPL